MVRPSGDQVGLSSVAGPLTSVRGDPPAAGTIRMSVFSRLVLPVVPSAYAGPIRLRNASESPFGDQPGSLSASVSLLVSCRGPLLPSIGMT